MGRGGSRVGCPVSRLVANACVQCWVLLAGVQAAAIHSFTAAAAPNRPTPSQAALHAAKADKGAMVKAAKKAEAILRQLVELTLRPDLTRIQRTNLETCITVHMHQKEVRACDGGGAGGQ